jgi:hypothetical protein
MPTVRPSAPPPPLFDEWRRCLFQRPPELCCIFNDRVDDFLDRTNALHFVGSNPEKLELFIYTMRHLPDVVAGQTDQQIAFGLNHIFNGAFSNLAHDLLAAGHRPERTREAIESIYDLYENFLRHRCSPTLGHRIGSAAEMDLFCYMLWDTSPLAAWSDVRDATHKSRPLLTVLERVLYIPHVGCIESALHGLGHVRREPNHDVIPQIIDRFLASAPGLAPELRAYALDARSSQVL